VKQDAILIAWPRPQSDWQPWLEQVENTYLQITRAICRFQRFIFCVTTRSCPSTTENTAVCIVRRCNWSGYTASWTHYWPVNIFVFLSMFCVMPIASDMEWHLLKRKKQNYVIARHEAIS